MKIALLAPLLAILTGGAIAADAPKGYLGGATVDLTRVLPPAPVDGDIRYATDRRVFKAMRREVGGRRWGYAIADIAYDTPAMLRDFSCAAGLPLTPEVAPATARLIEAASVDTNRANNAAKEHWRRLRPFWIDKGRTCEGLDTLGKSYDYPSGHTTKGWMTGLILAELLPDRAAPILTRARAYGESRIVCRVHNMSAVEAGRLGATVAMETVRATSAFQADLAAARAELAAARATGISPDPGKCAADAAVLEPSVLDRLKK